MLHTVLQWAGAAYLLWLGWKLLGSGEVGERQTHQADHVPAGRSGFQFLNPKSWVMSLSSMALFVPQGTSLLGGVRIPDPAANPDQPAMHRRLGAVRQRACAECCRARTARLAFNGLMAVALVATGVIMVDLSRWILQLPEKQVFELSRTSTSSARRSDRRAHHQADPARAASGGRAHSVDPQAREAGRSEPIHGGGCV